MSRTPTAPSEAVVTGSSSGIGAATCRRLVRDGWRVVGIARRPSPDACVSVQADIASLDGVANAFRHAPRLRLLVHTAAAVEPLGPLCAGDPADWRRAIAVNLIGTYHVLRGAFAGSLREPGGIAIHLTTGATTRARPYWSAYAASKAGAEHLVRIVAAELAGTGCAVCALDPGMTETPMQERIRASEFPDREHFVRSYEEQTSRRPDEVAAAVIELAGRDPHELNGRVFRVGSL